VRPTPFPDLNDVLAEFVEGLRRALGHGLVGAYLVGSFALGDADEHSDVDFIVVTAAEVTDAEIASLNALHGRLFALESPWAQHLEGSYVPAERFRRLDPTCAPFWFLDNGSTELVRDRHCNTALVRWVLRRRGVTLAGPRPASVVEPVSSNDLRREAMGQMHDYAAWARELTEMSQWTQPYLVLTCCRVLATLVRGEVISKRAASVWAAGTLDPEWRDLIERAQGDRPDPWGRVHRTADAALADRTVAFVDHALETTRGPLRGPSVQ